MEKGATREMVDHVLEVGQYFKSRLAGLVSRHDFIRQVKGRGLILGIELDFPGTGVLNELMRRGFLINCTQNTILRFVPPLIITENSSGNHHLFNISFNFE